MDAQFTTIGALAGLAVAIVLIIRKVQPAYSLILGALHSGRRPDQDGIRGKDRGDHRGEAG